MIKKVYPSPLRYSAVVPSIFFKARFIILILFLYFRWSAKLFNL